MNKKKKSSHGYAKVSDKKKSFLSDRKFQAMMNKAVKHCFATQEKLKKRSVSEVNDKVAAAFSKASISENSEDSISSKSQPSDSSSSSAPSSDSE